jgi:hypothetical protein
VTDFRALAHRNGRGRPLGAKAIAIREAVVDLTDQYDVMTVRQVFYQLVARGIIPKSENGGYRPVQTQVLKMRREGLLPWSFIADATRWQRKPRTWNSVEDVLAETARTYRRNLWISQGIRVEVWLEKDALAAVAAEATHKWDVPLMVSRGTSSVTFLYEAAQQAREAYLEGGVSTYIFALYDFDAAGRRAARNIERSLRDFARLPSGTPTPIEFELLAVTEEQISEWSLPTRPAKGSDPEAHKFRGEAVELDAIPPDKLIVLVENAIITLIDEDAWRMETIAEQSEREILERIAQGDE